MKRDMVLLRNILKEVESGRTVYEPIDSSSAAAIGFIPKQILSREDAEKLDWHLKMLEKEGLISVVSRMGNGAVVVEGLTMRGYEYLEQSEQAIKRENLKRDKLLLSKLLEKLASILQPGVTTSFDRNDPDLQIEGYSAGQIDHHLSLLIQMGLVNPARSQPAGGGAVLTGISPAGYDFLENLADEDVPERRKVFDRTVFIVHGHDDGAREAVARFLERIDFEPIILHEQAHKGRTIIEKFEAHGDVGFAVVLLTPDDQGCEKGGSPRPRARQNVVLELGYFVGKLGRERVLALRRGDVEIPSDFAGVMYENFDSNEGWHRKLAKELQAAGYDIDWNSVMRG